MYFQSELRVGETSPPPVDSPNSSSTHEATPKKFVRDPESSACFRCHKAGHWVRNCPEKSPIKPIQATRITSDSEFPHPLRCRCGFGHCFILTSRTAANPNRKFYTCPGTTGRQCGMFEWCDQVTMEVINSPPLYRFPDCNCGAGTCHLDTLKSGPNAGRKCFVCSIEKGEGACSFSQLFDAKRDTIVNGQAESKSLSYPLSSLENQSNCDLVEDGDVSSQRLKKRDFESPVMVNPQHLPTPVVISGPSKRNKVLLSEGKGHDEKAAISSPKLHDPLGEGFAANACSVPDSTRDLVTSQENLCGSNILKASLLTSQADIRCRQTEFWRQISSAGAASVEGSLSQVLGLHVLIWLGRIIFSPTRCLTSPSYKPFFCCVFPNFDPVHLFKDADTLETEGSVIPPHCPLLAEVENSDTLLPSTPGQDIQTSSGVFRDGGIEQANLMNASISEAFRQAALSMQSDLLNLLDSMDILDHEGMVREAKLVFSALDLLGVDYTPFRERVLEFIGCTSSLAAIELSIWDDLSSQELVDRYDHEKDHFNSLSCSHADTMAAFTASNERLRSLNEEATSIKNKLFDIENQLSACEAETKDLSSRLVEISEEMSVSQQSLQAASQEAEEASKLLEQREVERRTAKAALEKAKLQLRQ